LKNTKDCEEKDREYKKKRLTSIILFVIFIFGCVLPTSGSVKMVGLIFFALYAPLYLVYVVISLIVVYFCYRKILVLNIIVLSVIVVLLGLDATGFCHETKSFTPNKVAMIDEAVAGHISYRCNHEEYIRKKMGLEEKECSVSFNSIKEEAPHCFTKDRTDECVGDITYFDFKSGDIVKKNMMIYTIHVTCADYWSSCNFFGYALNGKGYSVSSGLGADYDMGRPAVYIFNSCGKEIRFAYR
jgi:hypothetical protein